MMPMFFMLIAIGGLRHPCVVAVLGGLFVVTRYFYFTSYTRRPQEPPSPCFLVRKFPLT
ncbi:hypothetical protein LINGRAPRIM_LOCUS439 [Linum grandiflorum]